MTGLAMSTRSDLTVKTFASLRFRGDRLEPGRITEILHATPTTAYRKGETYKRSEGHVARGRTGVWVLSTRGQVDSLDLNDHLEYLLRILYPNGERDRVERLHHLMRDGHIEANVGCFWAGRPEAPRPAIPPQFRKRFSKLPAVIEEDFQFA